MELETATIARSKRGRINPRQLLVQKSRSVYLRPSSERWGAITRALCVAPRGTRQVRDVLAKFNRTLIAPFAAIALQDKSESFPSSGIPSSFIRRSRSSLTAALPRSPPTRRRLIAPDSVATDDSPRNRSLPFLPRLGRAHAVRSNVQLGARKKPVSGAPRKYASATGPRNARIGRTGTQT